MSAAAGRPAVCDRPAPRRTRGAGHGYTSLLGRPSGGPGLVSFVLIILVFGPLGSVAAAVSAATEMNGATVPSRFIVCACMCRCITVFVVGTGQMEAAGNG